ncbi:hypothetical protein SteCoe_39557 [Stentor coeruleus]|uniref:Uncharacterized protein n=1 Tax=Stentor coeruleus TaxID=5963 RepID=A0A1R2AKK1_9CILI|nr:hypothetical protein SteCoe_39557 [Stentor coeruleus]
MQAEIKQYETGVQTSQKQLEQANARNKQLENEISNCNISIQDKQKKLKEYEINTESNKNSLNQANAKIKNLESDMIKDKKVIKESQEEIKQYKSRLITTENFLGKANAKIQEHEHELRNSNQKFACNLYQDIFQLINDDQKINFLVQENYLIFENDLINTDKKMREINMTNDAKFIFICKL